MTPQEVASYVETEMSQYRPCPYCGQYGSLENHQAGCVYLSARSAASPEEEPNGGETSTTPSSAGVDVATADVEPLPASLPGEAMGTAIANAEERRATEEAENPVE